MHALVVDGQVEAVGRLPRSARRLDTGQWVLGLHTAALEVVEACGWFAVADTARPGHGQDQTSSRTVELVDGTPTWVWTVADKTAKQLAAEAAFARQQAADVAARVATVLAAARLVRDGLDDPDAAAVALLFDPWQPGIDVAVGEVLEWHGVPVEALQAHTTQADWAPDVTPALWKVHRTDDGTGPVEWQPGISVVAGEQVTYQGVTYTVVQSHTTQAGWAPPNVPALFAPVQP
jgi:hypothetical protein